jgi:hypothetical protein
LRRATEHPGNRAELALARRVGFFIRTHSAGSTDRLARMGSRAFNAGARSLSSDK